MDAVDDLESNGLALSTGADSDEGKSRESSAKSKPKKNKYKSGPSVAQSALGARLFYFIAYGLYYLSLLIYKNPMRDILFFQKEDMGFGDLLYVLYYAGIHGLAIYFFLTAGYSPGFVDETETEGELKRRELANLSGQQQQSNDLLLKGEKQLSADMPEVVLKSSAENRKKPRQMQYA